MTGAGGATITSCAPVRGGGGGVTSGSSAVAAAFAGGDRERVRWRPCVRALFAGRRWRRDRSSLPLSLDVDDEVDEDDDEELDDRRRLAPAVQNWRN